MAKRSRSSGRWLAEHSTDHYVRMAREMGYRSRAVFKLMELDQRHGLFRPGNTVVDLGAAPGGWSQYAAERVGSTGRVLAVDRLPLEPLPGVSLIRGDFLDEAVLREVQRALGGSLANIVLSDMAPNLSGSRGIDQPRAMYLAELALDFAVAALASQGGFVVKLFQGEGFQQYVATSRKIFSMVSVRKPKASRGRSPEVYLVAMGFLGSGR
jgi:23S rRNA (uridine2552-2'-O)-methyltransferase